MKYMGSKNRYAKYILPIILEGRTDNQYYVEPFMGGANIIDKVKGLRIGGEINKYIIEMWVALAKGWIPENNYTKKQYLHDQKILNVFGVNQLNQAYRLTVK